MSAVIDVGTFKVGSIVRLTWGGKTYSGTVIAITEKFPMFRGRMMRGVALMSGQTRTWWYENEIDSFDVDMI